jgi:hypothetical protein
VALPDLSQIPRKTWIIAVGIAGGATAIMVWRNRDAEPTEPVATVVDDELPGYGGVSTVPGGTSPLISPVIIPGTGDPDAGGGALSELYIGALSGFLESQAAAGQIAQTTMAQLLLDQSAALAAVASAGGSPAGQQPVASTATPEAPTSAPIIPKPPPPAPAFKVEYRNKTKDNGLSGTKRKVWCVRQKIHRYPDGRGVVVSEDKLYDGACK